MINDFKTHKLAHKIDAERHKEFMKEALPHLIGGLITGVLLFYVFLDFTAFSDRIIWITVQILLSTSTIIFYSVYYLRPHALSLRQWEIIIFFVSLLWGCAWSLPPHILLTTSDSQYIAALLVITIALAITPAPAMVQYPFGYFVFSTLPLLSLFIKLLILQLHTLLVLFVPFFWLTVLAYGWRLHHTIIDSIRLRLEIDDSRNEAEKANISKSKFLAAASHDLRQPLQAITLFTSALKEKLKTNNGNSNIQANNDPVILINRLESSVDSMSELLNSLLDVSKLDAEVIQPKPQHENLNTLLKKITSEYAALAAEKKIILYHKTSDIVVFADPVLLIRVIGNLLNNAIRYTEKGNVSLNATIKNSTVIISISDTGIGIPEHEQSEIFTEFHQLHNPERNQKNGLGLGLSIVQRLCRLQQWDITLASEEKRGSTFSFTVPKGDANKTTIIKKSSDFLVFNENTVVIIEDDDQIRLGLEQLLNSWNCLVTSFSTSSDCLNYLAISDTTPDLILSDFRLENNETGLELIKRIRKDKNHDIPAIIITGDTAPERLKEAQKSGFMIIHKPVKAAVLRRIMQQILSN